MIAPFLDRISPFFEWLWRTSWQASVLIVLIFAVQWLFRSRLSPRWCCALWLLVVVRLLWPWPLETRASIFSFFNSARASATSSLTRPLRDSATRELAPTVISPSSGNPSRSGRGRGLLLSLWLAGTTAFGTCVAASAFRMWWRIRFKRPVTRTPVLNLLEDCKEEMGVHTPLTLVETSADGAPLLYGFVRPRLLLPAGLINNFSTAELRHIFLHELAHVKRGDIALNWLATAALVLHWFNPLVWLAFSRMRLERELACDALALSYANPGEAKGYGQTIIRLLERFSRPSFGPGMVGIVEHKNQMKRRIQMIAKFKQTSRWSALAVSLFIGLGIITLTDAQTKRAAGDGSDRDVPRIIATSPSVGETEVDPALKEITVTFDRDMAGGFSWTGGLPEFPPTREGQKAAWHDKRTAALPVKLEPGRYYRVGINSTSHQNFRSVAGVSALPSAIYFTTEGADEALKRKATKPEIVALDPPNGASDVDPNLKELRVTFNVPMGAGFSFTGGGPQFPGAPGKRASWSADKKTCVLPIELKPASEYRLGLNSPSHKNFQSASGVPLEPVVYTFKTKPN